VHSFYGKTLEINLSTDEQRETQIPEEEYHHFLGGSGLAARIYDQR
jgi:aldehyde:ferredoxin oxidoreductase